jgi:hypothetical protein
MRNLIYLPLLAIALISCEVINPEEEVPCYVKVDKAVLITDESTEGANTSNITDIWVNVDGSRQGTYGMPVTFPILTEGQHKLTFRAGIKSNGIAASRVIYPFFEYYEAEVNLNPDSVYSIEPVYRYRSSTVFKWLENFEDAGISLRRVYPSDTVLTVAADPAQPGNNVGYFAIDDTRYRFFYESSDTFPRPASGADVFLELDYRNDEAFIVGLKLVKAQYATYESLITLNPRSSSNKIYIDLGSYLSTATDVLYFGIYFYAQKSTTAPKSEFSIDNIKLLHF